MFNTPNNNYQPWYPNNYQMQQQAGNGIIYVQGEAAAKSFDKILPGQSIPLFDSEENCFYIKTMSAAGIPQPLEIYDYKKREVVEKNETTTSDFITREEFEKRLAEISNGKHNIPES